MKGAGFVRSASGAAAAARERAGRCAPFGSVERQVRQRIVRGDVRRLRTAAGAVPHGGLAREGGRGKAEAARERRPSLLKRESRRREAKRRERKMAPFTEETPPLPNPPQETHPSSQRLLTRSLAPRCEAARAKAPDKDVRAPPACRIPPRG